MSIVSPQVVENLHRIYDNFGHSSESMETFVFLLFEKHEYEEGKILIRLACQQYQASEIVPRSFKLAVYRDDINLLEWFARTYPRTTYKLAGFMRPWGVKCAPYFLRIGYRPTMYHLAQMVERNQTNLFCLVVNPQRDHLLDLVEIAIQYDRIEILRFIEKRAIQGEKQVLKKISHYLEIAVAKSSMKVLEWYFPKCRTQGRLLLIRAVEMEKTKVFNYLYNKGVRLAGPELIRHSSNRLCHRYIDYLRCDDPLGYLEILKILSSSSCR